MAPLVEGFHSSELPERVTFKPDGSQRKPPVNLEDCKLKEMIQYDCQLRGPKDSRDSKVVCEAVLRLFRQCADGLTVETTAWDDIYNQKQ